MLAARFGSGKSVPARVVNIEPDLDPNAVNIMISGDWMTIADFGGTCRVDVRGGEKHGLGDAITAHVVVNVPVKLHRVALRLVADSAASDGVACLEEATVWSSGMDNKECLLDQDAEMMLPSRFFSEPMSVRRGLRLVMTANDGHEAWNTIWFQLTRTGGDSRI